MSFPGKADRAAAPLDHDVLLAALAAQRASNAATRDARAALGAVLADEPITEIMLAGPGWHKARRSQQGSFNRDEAERRQ